MGFFDFLSQAKSSDFKGATPEVKKIKIGPRKQPIDPSGVLAPEDLPKIPEAQPLVAPEREEKVSFLPSESSLGKLEEARGGHVIGSGDPNFPGSFTIPQELPSEHERLKLKEESNQRLNKYLLTVGGQGASDAKKIRAGDPAVQQVAKDTIARINNILSNPPNGIPISPGDEVKLKQQAKNLQHLLSETAAAEQAPAQAAPAQAAPRPLSSTDKAGLEQAFAGAGMTMKGIVDFHRDSYDALKKDFGDDYNFDQPVALSAGVQKALQVLDPDGRLTQATAAAFAPAAQGMVPMAGEATPGMKPKSGTEMELEQNKRELKQKGEELAESEDMQSWGAVISFILLAFSVGPVQALDFMHKAMRNGKLRDYIGRLEKEREHLERKEIYEQQREDRMRAQAAEMVYRSNEESEQSAEKFRQQWLLTLQRGRQSFERARLSASDPEKAVYDKLEKDFNREMSLSAKAEKVADDLMKNEATRASARRKQIYHQQRAEGIHDMLKVDLEEEVEVGE